VQETVKIISEIKNELTRKETLSRKEKSQLIKKLEAEIDKVKDI